MPLAAVSRRHFYGLLENPNFKRPEPELEARNKAYLAMSQTSGSSRGGGVGVNVAVGVGVVFVCCCCCCCCCCCAAAAAVVLLLLLLSFSPSSWLSFVRYCCFYVGRIQASSGRQPSRDAIHSGLDDRSSPRRATPTFQALNPLLKHRTSP